MDTTKIKVMMSTVRTGSIRKAAKKLGYTQAGLIYLLNRIEDELGLEILERSSNGIAFNETGKKMEPYFTSLLDADAAIGTYAASLSSSVNAKLRIGSYSSIATVILPDILNKFHEENPNIEIGINIGVTDLVDQLDKGLVDLAFTEEAYAGEHEWIPLWKDEIICALRDNNPLAGIPTLALESVIKGPIVFPSINMKNAVAVRLQEMGINVDLGKSVIVSTNDGITVLYMTSAGLGNTFVSELWKNFCPENVVLRSLEPKLERTLGVVVKRGTSNHAVKRFIHFVKNFSVESKEQ